MTQPATAPESTGDAPPAWDLDDLYAGPDSPALARDLDEAGRRAAVLAERCKGRVAALDGAALAEAVAEYEAVGEILARAASYAELRHAADMSDPEAGRFLQDMRERTNAISSTLLFVTLELLDLDDDALAARLETPALARYAPWLRDLRAYRPHRLADDLERLLHEKQVSGRDAWVRLFDETVARLRFPFRGEALTEARAFDLLSSKDAETRRGIAGVLSRVLAENADTFALILNTLARDKAIEDSWRGHAKPISRRNLENRVEDEVVEALVAAVRDAFPRLAHRYYALKARWLGKDRLDWWDRNAPLPEDDDRRAPWGEARRLVLGAYAGFSPALARLAARFFDERWIDAAARPGKTAGAFSHPVAPSAHPFILMTYQGRARDVTTLAHELGHGVHQILAGPRGALMAETPLTLAETASVFGEQLTFRALLDAETDPARRRVLLAGKVEDALNTVVRQVAFCEFERRFHDRRAQGALTAGEIGGLWMDVQRESLGPAVRLDDDYRVWWSYIPHFVHTPFYVYAYAFGDCLTSALYAAYREAPEGFEGRYLDMLRAGGTLRHRELLAPFGLDASDPAFWRKGLDATAALIDALEDGADAVE